MKATLATAFPFLVAIAAAATLTVHGSHALAADETLFVAARAGAMTATEVGDELQRARASGTANIGVELGDAPEVLANRKTFAELQREVVENSRGLLAGQPGLQTSGGH